jgi:hypothetical protein
MWSTDVLDGYVLVQRGLINQQKFYIPHDQAENYDDGSVLRFRGSEEELQNKYMTTYAPRFSNHNNLQSTSMSTINDGGNRIQQTID